MLYNQRIPKPGKWRLIVFSRPTPYSGFQTSATRNWSAKAEKFPENPTQNFYILSLLYGSRRQWIRRGLQWNQTTARLVDWGAHSSARAETLLSLTFKICSLSSPIFSNTIHNNLFGICAFAYYIPSVDLFFTLFSKTILCILQIPAYEWTS